MGEVYGVRWGRVFNVSVSLNIFIGVIVSYGRCLSRGGLFLD